MTFSWKNSLKALPVLSVLAAYAGLAIGAAGNVQFAIGDVKVIDRAGVTRALQKGADVNEGDRIVTGADSLAQIKMVDGGFIAVRPNTNMGFDTYRYSGKEDGTESAVVSLLRGGFRTITGIIGRTNKQNYLVKTGTATIGIRGTDHEPMVILPPGPGQVAIAPPGTYDKVNVGVAFIQTDVGSIDIQRNQVGFAPLTRAAPVILPNIPPFYKPTPAPGPQTAAAGKTGDEQKAEATGQARSTTLIDPTATTAAATATTPVTATPVTATPSTAAPVVAIAMTDLSGTTLNATTQTVAASSGTPVPIGGSISTTTGGSTTTTTGVSTTTTTGASTTTTTVTSTTTTTTTGTGPTGGPFAAYTPSKFSIEVGAPFVASVVGNAVAAPADMTAPPPYGASSGLSSFIDRDFNGLSSNRYTAIGASGPVTQNANSFSTTGVQFGRWTSATALETSFTSQLGNQTGAPTTWMYGPQGYLDTPAVLGVNTGPLIGTFSYALDGSTAPYDRNSGQSGTLTSASISANFTNQQVSASLVLTVAGQAWSASTPSIGAVNAVSFGTSNQFFAGSSPGGTNNNLTVLMGTGTTPVACPTCFGNLSGAFTGQNYAGAILSYNLWDNGNAGGDIAGHAAFARTGTAIANGSPAATGKFFVADSGGNIQMVDTITASGNLLTAYSSGSPTLPANGYSSAAVTCTSCTVTPATNATTATAPTGVYFGTWDAGSYTNTFGESIGTASPHWITGPEAGPVFLPNALTGTKTFAFDGGMVTNGNGVAGTVLGTTALTVDFTKQVAGINVDLSINDTAPTPVPHTWNAKTLPGNEAVLNSGRGLGGAVFQASSFNGAGPGLLTVTVDGTKPGNGTVSGQLTGTGLNGAIMSYDLFALVGTTAPTFEQVNGVAALVGSISDVATPHRVVVASATDPSSSITQPVLGMYANAPSRMLTDVAGNLTQFDINGINNRGMNDPSHTLSSGTSVLTDSGTDPVTGISWGRWAGGSLNITNRADGTTQVQSLGNSSLHWIAGPTETAAVTLPVSGTFAYVKAGGTAPTDNLGNVGVLNSATLTANFTAQTVNVGVNTTVAGATLDATASAVPIIQRAAFAAGLDAPAPLTVTCSGTSCGTTQRGTIVGAFTGAGAAGALMAYSLQKIGANASITSGVVGLHR